MSISYHVIALREEDAEFKRQMIVLRACREAGVSLPKETSAYFGEAGIEYEDPERVREAALEVNVTTLVQVRSEHGHEDRVLRLEDLPKSVKSIIFRVSW